MPAGNGEPSGVGTNSSSSHGECLHIVPGFSATGGNVTNVVAAHNGNGNGQAVSQSTSSNARGNTDPKVDHKGKGKAVDTMPTINGHDHSGKSSHVVVSKAVPSHELAVVSTVSNVDQKDKDNALNASAHNAVGNNARTDANGKGNGKVNDHSTPAAQITRRDGGTSTPPTTVHPTIFTSLPYGGHDGASLPSTDSTVRTKVLDDPFEATPYGNDSFRVASREQKEAPSTPRITDRVPTPDAPRAWDNGRAPREISFETAQAAGRNLQYMIDHSAPTNPHQGHALGRLAPAFPNPAGAPSMPPPNKPATIVTRRGALVDPSMVKLECPCPPNLPIFEVPLSNHVEPDGQTRYVTLTMHHSRFDDIEMLVMEHFTQIRHGHIRDVSRTELDDEGADLGTQWALHFDDVEDAMAVANFIRRTFGLNAFRVPPTHIGRTTQQLDDIILEGFVCFSVSAATSDIALAYVRDDLLPRLNGGDLVRNCWCLPRHQFRHFDVVVEFFSLKTAKSFVTRYTHGVSATFDDIMNGKEIVSVNTQYWAISVAQMPQTGGESAINIRLPRHFGSTHRRNGVRVHTIMVGSDIRTTIMLRNLHYDLTAPQLKSWLEMRCRGWFDFLYLRMDFRNGCNVGYAFVNFVEAKHILKLVDHLAKFPVIGQQRSTRPRSIELSYATIQGREALIQKFRNSSVMTKRHDFRPKLLYAYPADEMENVKPYVEWVGIEQPFPECDNPTKMERSKQNQETYGLYHRNAARGPKAKANTSDYDNGSPHGLPYDQTAPAAHAPGQIARPVAPYFPPVGQPGAYQYPPHWYNPGVPPPTSAANGFGVGPAGAFGAGPSNGFGAGSSTDFGAGRSNGSNAGPSNQSQANSSGPYGPQPFGPHFQATPPAHWVSNPYAATNIRNIGPRNVYF